MKKKMAAAGGAVLKQVLGLIPTQLVVRRLEKMTLSRESPICGDDEKGYMDSYMYFSSI